MSNCSCCKNVSSKNNIVKEVGKQRSLKLYLARLFFALALAVVLFFVEVPLYIKLCGFLFAFFIVGFEVFLNALKDVFKGEFFDEHFLMSVAGVASFIIGEYFEAVALMVFFGVGDLLQELAVRRSRNNISKLMDIRPDYANLKKDGLIFRVHPSEVNIGDTIVVGAGERVALDGIISRGETFIDTSAITGESMPKRVTIGDSILSGTINNESVIEINVTKVFSESTVSKILELVENASDKKSRSEKFITKFAKVYTPIVISLAFVVAIVPPVLAFGSFDLWIYRAISFLVISCPCALVVSIPVGVFGGIGGLARSGVLIKGGNLLEDLYNLETVVFDKTGTLTRGVFEVSEIKPNGISSDNLVSLTAIAEQHSSHPIAKSIVSYYGKPVTEQAVITEKSGFGVIAKTAKNLIHAGSIKLMAEIGIGDLPVFPQTTVYVALDKKFVGMILISDKLKDGVRQSIAELSAVGIRKTVMLTGDNNGIASAVADSVGIPDCRAELLPQDKVAHFEQIKSDSRHKVAFVGDGINDAPVLKIADIGIAMGGVGSDVAIESADVVIMNDDIGKIATAKRLAHKTRRIIKQNIILSLAIKFGIMAFAFFGIASILMAVFADVGVALLAILNATRALSKRV